jgi:hypothetical protein
VDVDELAGAAGVAGEAAEDAGVDAGAAGADSFFSPGFVVPGSLLALDGGLSLSE